MLALISTAFLATSLYILSRDRNEVSRLEDEIRKTKASLTVSGRNLQLTRIEERQLTILEHLRDATERLAEVEAKQLIIEHHLTSDGN
jgi:hypothetical protein